MSTLTTIPVVFVGFTMARSRVDLLLVWRLEIRCKAKRAVDFLLRTLRGVVRASLAIW